MQKCKAVNVANKINKSMVENNLKDKQKIEIVAKARSKCYIDAVRYDQNTYHYTYLHPERTKRQK